MAGAVVQPGAFIGRNVIVNTRASVDHDCCIQDHVHIAPGSTLCGNVTVGLGAMVGAGAVVIPGLTIGAGAMIGAAAAVCSDVPEKAVARGVPAR
jgi:acetyltransferase-like isoleucine patch superfamily enzyme